MLIDSCEASDGATSLTAATIAKLTIINSPTIATRTLSGITRYVKGERLVLNLPNIAGSGIAGNGAYYDYVVTGIDCTTTNGSVATINLSVSGNGEGVPLDKYKVTGTVLNRTSTGFTARITNYSTQAQTVDVRIEVTN